VDEIMLAFRQYGLKMVVNKEDRARILREL
jgi:hypothetical protein